MTRDQQIGDIARVLSATRYLVGTEMDLQDTVGLVLTAQGIAFERERVIAGASRIDYYVPTIRVGLELKVTGSASAVLRQLFRYAECQEIDALMLITTHARHGALPTSLGGKPLHVVLMSNGGL